MPEQKQQQPSFKADLRMLYDAIIQGGEAASRKANSTPENRAGQEMIQNLVLPSPFGAIAGVAMGDPVGKFSDSLHITDLLPLLDLPMGGAAGTVTGVPKAAKAAHRGLTEIKDAAAYARQLLDLNPQLTKMAKISRAWEEEYKKAILNFEDHLNDKNLAGLKEAAIQARKKMMATKMRTNDEEFKVWEDELNYDNQSTELGKQISRKAIAKADEAYAALQKEMELLQKQIRRDKIGLKAVPDEKPKP